MIYTYLFNLEVRPPVPEKRDFKLRPLNPFFNSGLSSKIFFTILSFISIIKLVMPFKRFIYVCSGALLFLCSCGQSYVEELSTQYADLKVNDKGFICQIINKQNGQNYLLEEKPSPILALYDGNKYIMPIQMKLEGDKWIVIFENQSQATISKEVKENSYVRLSLESLTNRDSIQAIVWGPYATTISQYIGETVGVVRDTCFAIGVQGLNIFTTEGRPDLGDDAGGATYIDPLPGQTVPDEIKDHVYYIPSP